MKVDLTPEEWGDFVAIFLLDSMVHEDILYDNEEFRKLVDNLAGKGAKSVLLKYYLDLPSNQRVDYRRVRDSLIGKKVSDTLLKIKKAGDD